MSEIVTLELPEEVARSAREVAARIHRRLEDVLVEWIDCIVYETLLFHPPTDTLSCSTRSKLIANRPAN